MSAQTAIEASGLTCRFGDTLAVAGVDFRVAVLERGKIIDMGSPSELARRVVKTHNLAIEVEPDQAAHAESIARNRAVDAVERDGAILNVTRANRADIPVLVSALMAEGIRIYREVPDEPSLEDVYFALHNREER